MFSKERLADFILYSNFPHVFLITMYAYYYISFVVFSPEKSQFGIKTLPKSEWTL